MFMTSLGKENCHRGEGGLARRPQEGFAEASVDIEKPELTARHFGCVSCVFVGVSFR